jgi:SEC-C motif
MKAGRNDPCPCGSGKKYKKCCLAQDQSASETQPTRLSPPTSVSGSPGADSLRTKSGAPGSSNESARVSKAPERPSPADPATERADRRWKEFESQSEEGRITIFLETLDDAEVMTDDMAFEMLVRLHSDGINRGDRARFPEYVGALHEQRPEVYEQSAHFFLSWCVLDALAENRPEAVASLTRELAARAGRDIDIFNRTVDFLAYHGQLSVLVEAFRIAWPGVKSSDKIVPWGVSEFMNIGADYEIFDYLERTSSPDPADPVLLDRLKFFVEDPREDYLREFISDLTGKSGREWRADDFVLRRPRRSARDEWDDDDEEPDARDPAAINLSRLINEFVGYMRREEGAPFPRGQLVRNHLYSYFVQRHGGKLDPRPSMLDQALHPERKLPKPPRPAHPLCPERVTLEVFLAGLISTFNGMFHAGAAVFQAMPAWLRFLESRRLIGADLRRKVANEFLPLHATLSQVWQSYLDDPTLDRQGLAWPVDAAKPPSYSLP